MQEERLVMSELSVAELTEKLQDLAHWETFAIHLPGIKQTEIDTIKQNNPFSGADQRQALFHKWLRVYPNGSLENVLLALEKVDENSIIQKISNTLSEEVLFPKQHLVHVPQTHQGKGDSNTQELALDSAPTVTEQPIEEDTVQQLSDLHESFVALLFQCIQELKEKTKSGKVKLADMVMVTKLQGVYNVDDLNNVENIDKFFDVMKSQYHFLNGKLLLDLAKHFLKSTEILENLKIHLQKVEALKRSTKIRSLQRNLKPYVTKSPQEAPITIAVQYAYGRKKS